MASLYDSASLVYIPSAVKDTKAYSIKPTDGSGDFTFSRGSDIQATRVNSSGLIEKAKVNLLLQSNVFNVSLWASASMTLTSGQTGYDGSSDAWLIDSTGGYTFQGLSLSGVYTYSIYAKKGTADGIRLRIDAATDANAYISLTDGSESSPSVGIDSNATSVGGGWWRISLTINDPSIANVRFYAIDSSGSSTTGTIYIQDAALCHGLIAQEYLETTTTAVVEGLTADLPRLDYSGGASCPSLLLEPSRTNLIPHSEYIEDGGWTKSNATITTNHATSAEGVQNASLVTFSSGGYILESVTTTKTIGSTETISVFSNADISGTFLKYGGGTAAGTDVEDREVIGNGWYRYYVTRTFTEAETGSTQLLIAQSNVGNSVLIYGAQLEAGSYPTSYIPTYGTAANRGADVASLLSVPELIGSTEGTIFLEGAYNLPASGNSVFFELINSPQQLVFYMDDITKELKLYNSENPTNRLTFSSGDNRGVNHKIALAYKDNDFAVYLDGVAQSVTGTNLAPNGMANFFVNQNRTGGEIGQSVYKQILVFKTRLTNAELAALTA